VANSKGLTEGELERRYSAEQIGLLYYLGIKREVRNQDRLAKSIANELAGA